MQFSDPEKIEHALRELQRESKRRLVLRRAASAGTPGINLQVSAIGLDIENEEVRFDLVEPPAEHIDFRAGPLSLDADGGADLLCFTQMRLKARGYGEHQSSIFCTLPKSLQVTEFREHVRMPLGKGMSARISIRQFDNQPPTEGRLIDLSIFGCQLRVPVAGGVLVRLAEHATAVHIVFPSGGSLALAGHARHIRIEPSGQSAQIGFLFTQLAGEQRQKLWQWVRAIEQETAIRSGQRTAFMQPQALFQPPKAAARAAAGAVAGDMPAIAETDTSSDPVGALLSDVVRNLARTVVALRNAQPVPIDNLRAGASAINDALQTDRQHVLYTLCCFADRPELFRHSIGTAIWLADLITGEPLSDAERVDIIVAALLHDLGKTMLVDAVYPTLDAVVRTQNDQILARHTDRLLEQIVPQRVFEFDYGFQLIREISARPRSHVESVNTALSSLGAAARVVHRIDTEIADTRKSARATVAETYKTIHAQPEQFDRAWLKHFIQRHGRYPIGSLAHYSRGFLAWIMRLDDNGEPAQIRVVRNLAFKNRNMRDVLGPADFHQLGHLQQLVNPADYGLTPF